MQLCLSMHADSPRPEKWQCAGCEYCRGQLQRKRELQQQQQQRRKPTACDLLHTRSDHHASNFSITVAAATSPVLRWCALLPPTDLSDRSRLNRSYATGSSVTSTASANSQANSQAANTTKTAVSQAIASVSRL